MDAPRIFGRFFAACETPAERDKLLTALSSGWTEQDLHEFAVEFFNHTKTSSAMTPRDFMAVINSACHNDFFARRFLKRRRKRSGTSRQTFKQRSIIED